VDVVIGKVNDKGGITIPKRPREKYGITDKALLIEDEKGI
jgi:bifunctional DNA-binding transcriptional regulator/antitoxin component of YhaV-PrlF toxin-antitoxin module